MTPATNIQPLKHNAPAPFSDNTKQLIDEMCAKYELSREQIFVTEQHDLFFDFDALCVLANALGNFSDITVEDVVTDTDRLFITARAFVMLENGFVRRMFDTVAVGDVKPDGTAVKDLREAVSLVRARALRAALRAAGFDAVKMHRQVKSGIQPTLEKGYDNPWQKMNGEAHDLGYKLGLITKLPGIKQPDKTKWYRQLKIFFPEANTSRDLSDEQMSRWLEILRALNNAKSK